jgi:hypothetical protein
MQVPLFKEALFKHSNPLMIWLFLTIYTLPMITYSFLVSSILSKPSVSASLGPFVWNIGYVPFYLIIQFKYIHGFSYFEKFLMCLLPNSGMSFGFLMILKLEFFESGLGLNNLFERGSDFRFSVGDVMLTFLLMSLIFILATRYFEQVFPGKFGLSRPWYFPFETIRNLMKRCKKKPQPKKQESEEINIQNENFEVEPAGRKGIKIRNLTKKFKDFTAVNHLNLNMYEGRGVRNSIFMINRTQTKF